MKYNKSFENGTIEDYKKYLNGIKDIIPIKLYNFYSASEWHDLGEKSLDDSLIEKIDLGYELKKMKQI